MNLKWPILGLAISGLGTLRAYADDHHYPIQGVDVIHETTFINTPGARGFVHRFDWTNVTVQVDDRWSLVVGNYQQIDHNALDEAYLQYLGDGFYLRAGRQRGLVGLGTWSDLIYNVVARVPLIRATPLQDKTSLGAPESGLRGHWQVGAWELSGTIADGHLADRQVSPVRQSSFDLRAQTMIGRAVVGVSDIHHNSSPTSQEGDIAGFDVRWLQGKWKIVGEFDSGRGGGTLGSGYYADATYRFAHPLRPQIGIRQEEVQSAGQGTAIATAGLKVNATANLSFNLNYGFESPIKLMTGESSEAYSGSAYSQSLKGWSLQAMFAIRFGT